MTKPTVLIIDEAVSVGVSVSDQLDRDKYKLVSFREAAAAIAHLETHLLPNIVLISTKLPDAGVLHCARQIKAIADIPLIFMADADDSDTIIAGFNRFAEDFVVKPLDLTELELRIQMVLARMPSYDFADEPMIRVDRHLSIDIAHNRVIVGDKTVGLTPTESNLLHVLLRNAPRVVQNHSLLARVWPGEQVFEDTLRVHMHRLRRKLEQDSHHPHYIRTERGVGYRFTQRAPNTSEDED